MDGQTDGRTDIYTYTQSLTLRPIRGNNKYKTPARTTKKAAIKS